MKKWASTNINGLFHHGRSRILLAALLVALAMAYAPVARAAGVVSSCDEASLLSAISGGGTVTFACSGTITLTATITIFADTTIDGTGQNVTISGGNAVQVFSVPSGVQLNLNKLTITQGLLAYGIGDGGGIFNQGTLTVTNSTFYGNVSYFGGGGGIANFGTLTVINSTFEGNSAFIGGGIANFGTLTVTNSKFEANGAYDGGGIYNYLATLTVTNSTFSHNGGVYTGGGIYNYLATLTVTNSTFIGNHGNYSGGGGIYSLGTLTVSNSTFSGNISFSNGGGIYNEGGPSVTVTNSTFSDNGSYSGRGGGIFNPGRLTLRNTIVANSIFGGNCSFGSSLVDDGGNLDTDGTCVGTISPDPLLGPLQNNGGPTQTLAIPMASPAFGGANVANCPATDQRGVLRPQFLSCDIGAYEFGTANSLLAAVRNEISTLIPTGNQLDQRILSAAASALTAALNSHNWQGTDGNHLNPLRAEVVFELVGEGVSARLIHLLNASPPSAIPAQTLQTLLNNLTLAGRTLAAVAIIDAAGANATKLGRANALLAKGDVDAAAGKYVSALVDYEFAWALVQRDE